MALMERVATLVRANLNDLIFGLFADVTIAFLNQIEGRGVSC